jgi:hypothetical protein
MLFSKTYMNFLRNIWQRRSARKALWLLFLTL